MESFPVLSNFISGLELPVSFVSIASSTMLSFVVLSLCKGPVVDGVVACDKPKFQLIVAIRRDQLIFASFVMDRFVRLQRRVCLLWIITRVRKVHKPSHSLSGQW